MIVREFYKTRSDGVNLYRTYSDTNLRIRQIQPVELDENLQANPDELDENAQTQLTEIERIYDEAIDVEDAPWTYEEIEELIPVSNSEG